MRFSSSRFSGAGGFAGSVEVAGAGFGGFGGVSTNRTLPSILPSASVPFDPSAGLRVAPS